MKIFDLKNIHRGSKGEEKSVMLFQREETKLRTIILGPGEEIPPCDMKTYVIFHVINGSVEITVNNETHSLSEGFCLTTEPATISIRSANGSRLLGIQISNREMK